MQHPEATEGMITAALLHDAVEDQSDKISLIMIEFIFNSNVATLVDELTNKSKAADAPRAERKKMDRERIMDISRDAKIIKLCDRIDNLSEMA